MTRLVWRSRAFLCVALLLAACRDPQPLTQIVVQVDSDWDGFETVDIDIKGFQDPHSLSVDVSDKKHALPRRVTLVHDGGPMGPLSVTVSATDKLSGKTVLVEPRSEIFFVRDQTRLLKIDLLFACIGHCSAGLACVPGAAREAVKCVSSSSKDATKLVPWRGDVDRLEPDHFGDTVKGGGGDSGTSPNGSDADIVGGGDDAGDDAGDGAVDVPDGGDGGTVVPYDAGPDAGPRVVTFAYEPANVDPESDAVSDPDALPVALDCGTSQFDSSTLEFSSWCGRTPPAALKVAQSGGAEAAVLVMSTLSIAADSTLRLTGSRPVILLVFGDAHIAGAIDASAAGASPGPGASDDCTTSAGTTGSKAAGSSPNIVGGGGGGGGGFGTEGGKGGRGSSPGVTASGGLAGGEPTLVPLRGGCPGGRGGLAADGTSYAEGGAGGGAVQIAAAGLLDISGSISAAGGGGQVIGAFHSGGGGGGSGGAILLEGATLEIDPAAIISANGGGGGAGQPTLNFLNSTAGADGTLGSKPASGGNGSNSGGDGGDGAAGSSSASPGVEGATGGGAEGYGGSGGGGGGVGRVRLDQAVSCAPTGEFSPAPSISCETCGVCSPPPAIGCAPASHAGASYFVCSGVLTWQAARASCEGVGLQLIRVDDLSENTWLSGAIAGTTWIGATDSVSEGDWRWVQGDSGFWSGDDTGAKVGQSYVAWASGEPNNGPIAGDCAVIDTNGLWSDRSCTTSDLPYVCE